MSHSCSWHPAMTCAANAIGMQGGESFKNLAGVPSFYESWNIMLLESAV